MREQHTSGARAKPQPGPGVSVRVSGPVAPPVIEQLCSRQIHGAARTQSGSSDNFLREESNLSGRLAVPLQLCAAVPLGPTDWTSALRCCLKPVKRKCRSGAFHAGFPLLLSSDPDPV
ncbi:hypothetical protein OJAV_G00233670 [Oryzias javanicus]|uniref:Uncharacterized protein n=1 Tax=Oryzias javanicus TaxID=123683 RepID=A0A3S2PA53_ORYJA|nr:hypothetical protein OJAV_G00233670 [Oryzias javanicus]